MRQQASRLWAVVAFTAIAATIPIACAVDVFTEPVGFFKVDLLTNSDTFTSIPFTQIPEFRGVVNSVAGNVITVNGSPGWTANQWATTTPNGYYPYMVLLQSGAKEGQYYTITNNAANTLTVG